MKKLIFAAFVILTFGILLITCQEGMSPDQVSQEADPPQIESCNDNDDDDDPKCGRMTGGGSVFIEGPTRVRVTRGFEIHCDLSEPNNLQVNWKGGNKFHLTELDFALCTDDPAIEPNPPGAPFDTFYGKGTGRYNKEEGVATIIFEFKDAGEPGKKDTASIDIWYPAGNLILSVSGEIKGGNLQAHDDKDCELP